MSTYQFDTLVKLTTTFTEKDGVTPVDPTTVTLYIKTPDGTVTAYTGGEITRVSTGVYTYEITTSQVGRWIYKWQGTGACEITSPDVFLVVAGSNAMPD